MPIFELQDPTTGKTYEVDAPSADEAVGAFKQFRETPSSTKKQTGTLAAAAHGIGQGLTFGFSDELEGAVRGGFDALTSDKSFSDAYGERVGAARERLKQAADDQPLAYYGGEIGGAVVLPGGLARLGVRGTSVAANAGLRARSAAAAREGAAYGAAFGAGHGEGIEGKVLGTATGGVTGGAVGSVFPAAVDAGSAVWRGLVSRPVSTLANPERVGNQKLAEALLRDRIPGSQPHNLPAALDSVNQRLAAARQTKPEMMLADMGGENTRNLLRSAANVPSTGAERLRKTLDVRQTHQWRRIERDMTRALGNPDEYATTVGDVIARRGQQAATDFDAAMSADVPLTPALRSVLERPAMQTIMRNVQAALQNEGQAVGRETRMQALHRLKIELDNQIGQARRARAMGNDRTAGMDERTLTILKRDLLATINNPAYRRALDNYAGESALASAAEDGFENALRMHVEEIGPMLRRMTAGEREMWRLGASRSLAEKVRQGNKLRDRTENVFSSPDMQLRLNAILPDRRSRREFQRALIMEARMADTRKAVQGNSTTTKQLVQGAEAGQDVAALSAMANAATGRFEPLMRWLGRQANNFTGLTPTSANAIIEAAMTRSGNEVPQALREALNQAARIPEVRAMMVQRMLAASNASGVPRQMVGNQ